MKSLFVTFLITLTMATQALAAARPFRINQDSMAGRYAIGWGVQGQSIDFEAIEQQGDDAVRAFVDANFDKFENYLIDTETNTIVMPLTDPNDGETTGRLGSIYFGNHFSLDVNTAFVSNQTESDISAVISQTGHKWSSEITAIYIMKDANGTGKTPTVFATNTKAQEQLESQIVKHLSGERLKLWQDGAHEIIVHQSDYDYSEVPFEIYSSVPKSEGPTLIIKGIFTIDAKQNYAVVLKKSSSKIER